MKQSSNTVSELLPALSVVICTHNPRADYLRRTLEALQAQDLPQEQWELLLIDNASNEAVERQWDLSWHPLSVHIREMELGLTTARLRGIKESRGELLIFVDDDNVLASNYLRSASDLFNSRCDLGVASGRLLPEYETAPPEWFRPYESWIAVRRIDTSLWSNFWDPRSEPCGAGMCLRRQIGLAYARKAQENTRQRILDRKGENLLSGGDVAITKVAMEMGYSMGQFAQLNAVHLIPSRRVSEKYLLSLYCNLQASGQLLGWLEKPNAKPLRLPNWRVFVKAALRLVKGSKIDRRLVFEEFRAASVARKVIKEATANPALADSGALQRS